MFYGYRGYAVGKGAVLARTELEKAVGKETDGGQALSCREGVLEVARM